MKSRVPAGSQLTKNSAPDNGKRIYVNGCQIFSTKENSSVAHPINIPRAVANQVRRIHANMTLIKSLGKSIWLKK